MSRSFNAEGVLLTKIRYFYLTCKKYLQVSHTNTNSQFKVFVRKFVLFRDKIIGVGVGMGRISFSVV